MFDVCGFDGGLSAVDAGFDLDIAVSHAIGFVVDVMFVIGFVALGRRR